MKHDLSKWRAMPGAVDVVCAVRETGGFRVLLGTDGAPDYGVLFVDDHGRRTVVWREGESADVPDADPVADDGRFGFSRELFAVPRDQCLPGGFGGRP